MVSIITVNSDILCPELITDVWYHFSLIHNEVSYPYLPRSISYMVGSGCEIMHNLAQNSQFVFLFPCLC